MGSYINNAENQIRQLERSVRSYFNYIDGLIERENTFTMEESTQSVDAFLLIGIMSSKIKAEFHGLWPKQKLKRNLCRNRQILIVRRAKRTPAGKSVFLTTMRPATGNKNQNVILPAIAQQSPAATSCRARQKLKNICRLVFDDSLTNLQSFADFSQSFKKFLYLCIIIKMVSGKIN